MRNITFLIICAFAFTGCAVQPTQTATRAQTELIGMSKKELLSCAGVPLRQERIDDFEFLSFVSIGDSIETAVVTNTSSTMAVAEGKSSHPYCEATFVLQNGIVQKINYQSRGAAKANSNGAASLGKALGGLIFGKSKKSEQCAFIVENCLKQEE